MDILSEYECRFEKEYGFLRPIVKDVVEKYLDCGNPRCGFARIRCPRCHTEHLLLKLSFAAERPPPPLIASQEVLMAAETSAEYFS